MDKREAVRVPVRVHARCRLATGVVVDGLVEDVSRSGLFLTMDDDDEDPILACGSSTFVALELAEKEVQIEARVVRSTGSGVGLRFVDGNEPVRRELANFIMRQAHAAKI